MYSSLDFGFGHCRAPAFPREGNASATNFTQILRNAMVLGFGGCFAGSVGYDKGNARVDEETLTRLSDDIKGSSEK